MKKNGIVFSRSDLRTAKNIIRTYGGEAGHLILSNPRKVLAVVSVPYGPEYVYEACRLLSAADPIDDSWVFYQETQDPNDATKMALQRVSAGPASYSLTEAVLAVVEEGFVAIPASSLNFYNNHWPCWLDI